MNSELSAGAWVALICILGTVLLSGVVLFSAWQQRGKERTRPMNSGGGFSLTRGWQKEDEEIKKLANAVKNLRGDKKDST